MADMILIITNENDITSDLIVNELNLQGFEYYRFNTEKLGKDVGIHFDFEKNNFLLIDRIKNKEIEINNIKSVYYRRPELPKLEDLVEGSAEVKFILREYWYTLEGLFAILKSKFWISPIWSIRQAENKVMQLMIAKEIGFLTPDSIISTEMKKTNSFLITNPNGYVVKPIKSGLIENKNQSQMIFTSKINLLEEKQLKRIEEYPTYFQKNIEKEVDVRVTIVGKKIFGVKIDSQKKEESMIDWRKGDTSNLSYERIELPKKIESMCIKLMNTLNLNFGAIDFILDKNHDFVFLEINPNGQWGWIDNKLNLGIKEEIVNLLKMSKNNEI